MIYQKQTFEIESEYLRCLQDLKVLSKNESGITEHGYCVNF